MLVVGLTGGIGSGKSTVAQMFVDLGVPVIDTDVISHRLTANGGSAIAAIRAAFGEAVFLPDGALDRAALRAAILADDAARQALEAIVHPMIRDLVEQQLAQIQAQQNVAYVIVVIPLLFESGNYRSLVNRVLVVDCSESLQISRVQARSGWPQAQILAFMARQLDRASRLAGADDVILNESETAVLAPQIAQLHQRYLAMAGLMQNPAR